MYRQIYSENEPIEKHPPRIIGDNLVVINKITGYPCIGTLTKNGIAITFNGIACYVSSNYWEIAWP